MDRIVRDAVRLDMSVADIRQHCEEDRKQQSGTRANVYTGAHTLFRRCRFAISRSAQTSKCSKPAAKRSLAASKLFLDYI